ncbi:MAG: PHP domain-containing protein [Candidatus Dormibacteraceae bacterium]
MTYEDAAAVLAEIAYRLRHDSEQAFRARAYGNAAAALQRIRPDLAALRSGPGLDSMPGIGAGIAKVLTELLDTGHSAYLEKLRAESGDPAPVPAAQGVNPALLVGDLHAHTDWSDGHATVLEMALAAQARGYRYLAITDHSPRIRVVNGLGPERLAAQAVEIARATAQLSGFEILRGIECDILEDGSLDLPDETLAGLDIVLASPHVGLKMAPDAMTERMLRAVESPHVDIVAHPTGRRLGTRPGATYDFEAVFRHAARHGTAMEMDCDPARMDLSPELARLAADCGCRLSLDSDAHTPEQLAYVDQGAWMARQAGIGPELLLNCLPPAELREHLRAPLRPNAGRRRGPGGST